MAALRADALERRKVGLAKLLRRSHSSIQLTQHVAPRLGMWCSRMRVRSAWWAPDRSGAMSRTAVARLNSDLQRVRAEPSFQKALVPSFFKPIKGSPP